MKKTFVLDTNVILFDPRAIYKFGKHKVFIPLVVFEEVDRFKRDQSENGRNARYFSRLVDELRSKGTINKGVSLDSGGTLVCSYQSKNYQYRDLIDLNAVDNSILSCALSLRDSGENVFLITKDINLRLKADILGITAEDYSEKKVSVDDLYSGVRIMIFSEKQLQSFEENRFLEVKNSEKEPIYPNEYITMTLNQNDRRRVYGRYCSNKKGIVPLITPREGIWGIHPKSLEQSFAFDALLNEDVKLVTLVGKAGTGKTLMAIAAGLDMTVNNEKYSRLLVSRPVQPMGRDLGFLPGDVNEKLAPWMQPIFDNMDFLFGQRGNLGSYEELMDHGLLHVEPLTYIRGRSIPGQYIIVDEAQNLSPHEVKTIITRVGNGTKIILSGDCNQIDNPYLDEINNGLAYCLDRLKDQEITAHTTLKVGERSLLSEIASKLL